MTHNRNLKTILLIVVLLLSQSVQSQRANQGTSQRQDTKQITRILFILDCSNSMYGMWQSNTKIKIAQNLVSNIIDSLAGKPNVEVALRAYGHTKD